MDTLDTAIAALMRRVANDIVMPRYQTLAAHEISEKTPGDLVTIADQESEVALAEGLTALLPEARVVGEEACAADPALLDGLGEGLAWIIDPIDGTGNFAAGKPPFALMIALVDRGETLGGWIYDPVGDRLCHARQRGGAFINGERIIARGSGAALPVAGISTLFMDANERATTIARAAGLIDMVDIPRCAGEQYPRIVLGVNDLSVFNRTLPWDHVPGVLFLSEAGGAISRTDGSAYRFWDHGSGLIAGATPALHAAGLDILYR